MCHTSSDTQAVLLSKKYEKKISESCQCVSFYISLKWILYKSSKTGLYLYNIHILVHIKQNQQIVGFDASMHISFYFQKNSGGLKLNNY